MPLKHCILVDQNLAAPFASADRPAQNHSGSSFVGQSLLCPLRNKIPLDFRREAECKCDYLRIDAVGQLEAVPEETGE